MWKEELKQEEGQNSAINGEMDQPDSGSAEITPSPAVTPPPLNGSEKVNTNGKVCIHMIYFTFHILMVIWHKLINFNMKSKELRKASLCSAMYYVSSVLFISITVTFGSLC